MPAHTEDFEDYLAIKYNAKTVNAVLGHDGGPPYRVRITLDGIPLSPDDADTDVRFDDMGNSYLHVDESKDVSPHQDNRVRAARVATQLKL